MSIEEIATLMGIVTSVAFVLARMFIDKPKKSKDKPGIPPTQKEQDPYGRLLSKTLGDHAKAKRLIEYERRKSTGKTEQELILAAIERWEQDRR